MNLTDTPQSEYWYHVADQVEIPIAGIIDKSIDTKLVKKLADELPENYEKAKAIINTTILFSPDFISTLRTLVGISDKRMYLELSYRFSKEKFNSEDSNNILGYSIYDLNKKPLSFFIKLISNNNKNLARRSLDIISSYLIARGLVKILHAISKVNENELDTIIEKLILTKEVQQAEAKRRGHGAEHQLAVLIHKLGLKMIPDKRHIKAIGFKDQNVDRSNFLESKKIKGKTWSFDLIVKNADLESVAFIQSLIHTSDPGQYGVNKSDETILIKSDLIKHNRTTNSEKELWGIVDGVGFCENKKDTIDKMISEFDCFIQMKTLYKVGLRLHRKKIIQIKAIMFDSSFYTNSEAKLMYDKYALDDIQLVTHENVNSSWIEVLAGKATLYL